jgi:hypothetical protein
VNVAPSLLRPLRTGTCGHHGGHVLQIERGSSALSHLSSAHPQSFKQFVLASTQRNQHNTLLTLIQVVCASCTLHHALPAHSPINTHVARPTHVLQSDAYVLEMDENKITSKGLRRKIDTVSDWQAQCSTVIGRLSAAQ